MSRISLNTNISSVNAQRSLNFASAKLEESFTRLSSGLRINKSSDDAAGLAVASLLNVDRSTYVQGVRNLNDGVSYLNIAESALTEMGLIVTRIQELAEQSANGTLSVRQREPLQDEVEALQSEYNRILNSTKFNNMNLMTGENTLVNLQGGYGAEGGFGVQIGRALLSSAFGELSAGETTIVSTNSSGQQANASILGNGLSGDGRYITFLSSATNLVSGATGAQGYLKDMETGEYFLASTDANGVQGNGTTTSIGLDDVGKYMFISSNSTNFTGATGAQLYLKNRETGSIILGSSNSAGVQSNGATNSSSGISADGRYLSIYSNANNLVSGVSGFQLYRKDLSTGGMSLVSGDASGVAANAGVGGGALSPDGRYYAFSSASTNLVSGVTGNQVYQKDMETGAVRLVSSDASGAMGTGGTSSAPSPMQTDGRYVLFTSTATNLISGVSGSQIYRKDMQTGAIDLVSSNSSGQAGNGTTAFQRPNADGRYVAFISDSTNLVSGVSGSQVYRKDMQTGTISLVSRSTNGQAATMSTPVSVPRMSADGKLVAFLSDATNLTSNDANGVNDYFIRDMSKAGVEEISGMNVSTGGSALITLELAKNYQEQLSLYRAGIGASSSRIDTAISALTIASENIASAISQIKDVDVAVESARLTANSILKQSASEVLKQANNQPRLAIQLLRES